MIVNQEVTLKDKVLKAIDWNGYSYQSTSIPYNVDTWDTYSCEGYEFTEPSVMLEKERDKMIQEGLLEREGTKSLTYTRKGIEYIKERSL